MRWTGVIVGLFLIFHLVDLTWGTANPDFVRGDVYHNLVDSFERPAGRRSSTSSPTSRSASTCFHGAWSMFQSLGLNNPRYNSARRGLRRRLRRHRR